MCKNTYLYLLLGLLFMNCSSDNSNMDNISEEFSVVGSWELTSYTFENSYDFNKDGVASNDFISETACFDDIFINLNADGTGEIIDPNNLSFSFRPSESKRHLLLFSSIFNLSKLRLILLHIID